jgi:nucleoside diphosphate kinase
MKSTSSTNVPPKFATSRADLCFRMGLADQILHEIDSAGFTVLQERHCKLRLGDASLMFAHLHGRPDFGKVVSFMSDSPLIVLELQRPDAVNCLVSMCGPSDPAVAKRSAPASLRARFGTGAQSKTWFVAPCFGMVMPHC